MKVWPCRKRRNYSTFDWTLATRESANAKNYRFLSICLQVFCPLSSRRIRALKFLIASRYAAITWHFLKRISVGKFRHGKWTNQFVRLFSIIRWAHTSARKRTVASLCRWLSYPTETRWRQCGWSHQRLTPTPSFFIPPSRHFSNKRWHTLIGLRSRFDARYMIHAFMLISFLYLEHLSHVSRMFYYSFLCISSIVPHRRQKNNKKWSFANYIWICCFVFNTHELCTMNWIAFLYLSRYN